MDKAPTMMTNTQIDLIRRRFGLRLLSASSTTVLFQQSMIMGAAVSVTGSVLAQTFDQSHALFDGLLKKHVSWNAAGTASTVNYRGFMADRATLKQVLEQYSGVTRAQYDSMRRDEKLAFLINVYNAGTIELILTKYPDLKSIKDIGGVFGKPWGIKFLKILGEDRHLDNIEHDMIRAKGVFDEPRVHFVVNCASIGCPALRPEAIVASKLEAQLEDNTRRFLRDKTRNRVAAGGTKLEVSKIFDWFKIDWTSGYKGISTREQFFAKYAEQLSDDPSIQQAIRESKLSLGFLDYDWGLNDRRG
jgi:Protein of unknown function, DUF547